MGTSEKQILFKKARNVLFWALGLLFSVFTETRSQETGQPQSTNTAPVQSQSTGTTSQSPPVTVSPPSSSAAQSTSTGTQTSQSIPSTASAAPSGSSQPSTVPQTNSTASQPVNSTVTTPANTTTVSTPSSSSASENRSGKKYNLKSKGMKLTEIDEDGDPINTGKRYAVIVGINDYNDSAIADLSKARNDAKAVGKILKEIGQFDSVFVMTDDIDVRNDPQHLYPTKLKIEEKIESVLRFINPEDMVVFFFSGHGISDYDENGYLVTADTVADKKFETSLKVDWIVQRFKDKKIRKSLLILDACRDILYSSKNTNRDSIKEKVYTEAEVAATFYSTKAGYYSYEDDESDYGVFTKHLIYGMEGRADENKDGVVSFGELEQYVNRGVKDWSIKKNKQQKPFTKIYGEKTGDLAITAANNPEKSLADKKTSADVGPLLWRSAIIPGWGQWHNEQKFKGSLFFVSFIGAAALLANSYNNYKSAENKYLTASQSLLFYPSDPLLVTLGYRNVAALQSGYQSQAGTARNASLAVAAVYLLNLFDVPMFSRAAAFSEEKTGSLQLYASVQTVPSFQSVSFEKILTANYTWRF